MLTECRDPLTFRHKTDKVLEMIGHVIAHLNVSLAAKDSKVPSDINLFLTFRRLDNSGQEVSSPEPWEIRYL